MSQTNSDDWWKNLSDDELAELVDRMVDELIDRGALYQGDEVFYLDNIEFGRLDLTKQEKPN